METGNVGVNVAIPQPYSFFPLGSKKQSFLGTAKSRYASILDEKNRLGIFLDLHPEKSENEP
jgi:malonate-semialdehyde dehydrogenase (acetylating)/methylmalonate-semialdehyde dehydrogenase